MRKYRIKKKNKQYYPQYQNGFRTLWSWEYFIGTWYEVFPKPENIHSYSYTQYRFKTEEEARDFIKAKDLDYKAKQTKIIDIDISSSIEAFVIEQMTKDENGEELTPHSKLFIKGVKESETLMKIWEEHKNGY